MSPFLPPDSRSWCSLTIPATGRTQVNLTAPRLSMVLVYCVMECSNIHKTNMQTRQHALVLHASFLHSRRNSEAAKLHNDTQLGSLQTLPLKVRLCALGGSYPSLEISLHICRPEEAGRLS